MNAASADSILANLDKTDAEIVALIAAQPPVAKPSDTAVTYATYLSIGRLFGNNAAGTIRANLLTWCIAADLTLLNPALPNVGALQAMHSRLDTSPGIDLSVPEAPTLLGLFAGEVNAAHPPILTQDQVGPLLAIGYVLPEQVSEADVAAFRAEQVRGTKLIKWIAAKAQADAKASAVIDADPINATVEAVAAAYAAELMTQMEAA